MPILFHGIVWGVFFITGLSIGLIIGLLSVIPGGGKRL